MNNTSDKLIPCSYCGSTWTALDILTDHRETYPLMYVQCDNCDSTGGAGDSVEEVIVNWNKEQQPNRDGRIGEYNGIQK